MKEPAAASPKSATDKSSGTGKSLLGKSSSGLWHYVPREGHWDEALTPGGFPRRHWRELLVALGRMGPEQLNRRWRSGQHLIQANGITYNVYGDAQGKERPWNLDLIPLVIDGHEWEHIEQSMIQRATLLNAILADAYGSQTLIHRRNLPAEMLFANPNFLRPCCGIVPPGGVHLHLYAADLARSPRGQWWVIADRTQAPSGIGYALENRLVSAQTLPSVFNQCRVRQLGHFYETARNSLTAVARNTLAASLANSRIGARNDSANPRVVLLTPGPHNETYFEHSFLARQWGFPLVEGADLTVRDNRVFLKTLAGLEPVDLVMRRMDDAFCDPLELRGDSLLGVPGLVQAVRAGNVAVANALGSGLAETALHMAFLPGLSRQLLGEELRMPSVATWWCGDSEPRRYVLDHLDELVIKPTFPRFGQNAEFPAQMSAGERHQLAARIEAQPERFLAQEQVELSTAPVRTEQEIAARHIVLRVFAVWDGSSYSVLPGGLTRVSLEDQSLVVSMQLGGGSKDTWVLGQPAGQTNLVSSAPEPSVTARSSNELPSRVADNFFWLGRYAERVESGVRLVRVLLPGLSGEGDFGRSASIDSVVHLLGGLGYLPPEFALGSIATQRWNLQRLLGMMVFDPTRMSGIGWNLKQIRRATWPLKERLSQDTWCVLQQLDADFSMTPPAGNEQRFVTAMDLLDRAIVTLSAFAGLLMENTTRGSGWRFLEIGRRLERCLQMTELLRVGIAQAPFDVEPYLEMLLQIADSSITYRTRYFTAMRTEFVLQLLLADDTNPRSVAFQLATLADHIRELPGCAESGREPIELSLTAKLQAAIREAGVEDLAAPNALGNVHSLEDILKQIRTGVFDISDAVSARYFSHLTPSRLTSF